MGRRDMIAHVGDVQSQNERVVTVMRYNGTGGTLAAGDLVCVDRTVSTYGYGKHIKQSPATDVGSQLALGFVISAIPDGTWGEVLVEGIITTAAVSAGVAAGNQLYGANGTTGAAGQAVPGAAGDIVEVDFPQVGLAITAAVANVATVLVTNPQKVSA